MDDLMVENNEVIKKNQQIQNQSIQTQEELAKETIESEKIKIYKEALKLDEFDRQVYRSDYVLSFYPEQLRGNQEFNQLLEYRNQQQVYTDDYVKRDNQEAALECKINTAVANVLIDEKINSFVDEVKEQSKNDMESFRKVSPIQAVAEEYKSYPAELQKDDSFKSLVIYKEQLKDYRENLIHVLNTNTDNLYIAMNQGAAPEKLLQFEAAITKHELVYMQKIAELTDKINNLNFSIQHQVSQYDLVKPVPIPTVDETVKEMKLRTANQIPRLVHKRENLQHIGKMINDIGIFQTRDGKNFIGRLGKEGNVEQIGRSNSLKEISKNFKNFAKSVKLELKQEQTLKSKIPSMEMAR